MNDRTLFFSPLITRDEDWPHINQTNMDGENKDDNNATSHNTTDDTSTTQETLKSIVSFSRQMSSEVK